MFTWKVDSRRACHVVLRYVDAQGEQTIREILPLALEGRLEGQTFRTEYVDSHCYVAKASRTFRVAIIYLANTRNRLRELCLDE